jgi:hypothetical protein
MRIVRTLFLALPLAACGTSPQGDAKSDQAQLEQYSQCLKANQNTPQLCERLRPRRADAPILGVAN